MNEQTSGKKRDGWLASLVGSHLQYFDVFWVNGYISLHFDLACGGAADWSVPKTGFFVFLVRGPNYLDHEIWSGPQIWSDEKNVLPNIVHWTISGRNLSENRVRLRAEFGSQKLVQRTPKKRKVRFWERSSAVASGREKR